MHIDSIRLFRVGVAQDEPAPMPGETFESVVVAVSSGDETGWGEVSLGVAPRSSREWSAGVFCCARDWLAPAILGRSIDSGQELQQALAPFAGNEAAKSTLDVAWWNLAATLQNKPLYEMLGGRRVPVPLGTALGQTASAEELFELIRLSLSLGYQNVSLKFRPGWDVEMLRAVRQAFPDAPLAIDCDGLCSLSQQEMLYRVEDFFVEAIEQPLPADDLVGHAMLQENLRTPIMLDQSVTSLAHVEQAIDLGSCRRVRIDLARVGGLTPALAIHEACTSAGIPCAVGATGPAVLHQAAAMALATLPNFSLPTETFCHFEQPGWIAERDGCFEGHQAGELAFLPGKEPAAGVRIDAAALAGASVEQHTVG